MFAMKAKNIFEKIGKPNKTSAKGVLHGTGYLQGDLILIERRGPVSVNSTCTSLVFKQCDAAGWEAERVQFEHA